MSLILAALCVGWECTSPYTPASWWHPVVPGAVARVYLERASGCLVRTDGTLATEPDQTTAPTYLPPQPALLGVAVDVGACGAAWRRVPLGAAATDWVEVR